VGAKYTGVGKIAIFDNLLFTMNGSEIKKKKRRFSIEIAAYLGNGTRWNVNRKSQVADRSVSVSMTLSDLERRGARGQFFSG